MSSLNSITCINIACCVVYYIVVLLCCILYCGTIVLCIVVWLYSSCDEYFGWWLTYLSQPI